MRFADRAVRVGEGEVILVPRGIEHCPRTKPGQEAQVMLVELRGTAHTGNVQTERTVKEYPRI
jgi:mannose-6-phosphate isomerase-like protein (cupin superfamily)